MHLVTVTIVVSVQKSAVFNYMTDPANLPEWAIEFCHEETGVIDLYASIEGKRKFPFATRVLPLANGQTAYTAIFFQEQGVPYETYQQQLGAFRMEMDNMKSLFTQ